MINKIAEALQNGDFMALAGCFAEDGKYFDYCPATVGKRNIIAYGRDGVEMLLRNRFAFKTFSVFDPVVTEDGGLDFYGYYEGIYVHAKLEIETAPDGLVRRLAVHPA